MIRSAREVRVDSMIEVWTARRATDRKIRKKKIWKLKFEIDSGIFLLEEGREKVYLNKNKRENNIEIIILLFYIVILYK